MLRKLLLLRYPGWRWAILYPTLAACSAATPAPKPPCDSVTLAAKLAECAIHVRACAPYPAPCPAEDACFAWAEERQARCVD